MIDPVFLDKLIASDDDRFFTNLEDLENANIEEEYGADIMFPPREIAPRRKK